MKILLRSGGACSHKSASKKIPGTTHFFPGAGNIDVMLDFNCDQATEFRSKRECVIRSGREETTVTCYYFLSNSQKLQFSTQSSRQHLKSEPRKCCEIEHFLAKHGKCYDSEGLICDVPS